MLRPKGHGSTQEKIVTYSPMGAIARFLTGRVLIMLKPCVSLCTPLSQASSGINRVGT